MIRKKICRTCGGRGWVFVKENNIFTGKYDRFMGFEIPRMTSGMVRSPCSKCFGRGVR